MTIPIAGGNGLVGARLLPRLVEAGIRCRALVRAGKTVPSGVAAVAGDLLDPASLVDAVAGVEAIIHLAAVLRTPDQGQIWRANVDGARNLIAAARDHAADARFIMASNGLVYSEVSPGPSRESDTVAPERDYPASKVAAERLLQDSGLNWSVLRFGFVYGDAEGHIEQIPQIAHILKLHRPSACACFTTGMSRRLQRWGSTAGRNARQTKGNNHHLNQSTNEIFCRTAKRRAQPRRCQVYTSPVQLYFAQKAIFGIMI